MQHTKESSTFDIIELYHFRNLQSSKNSRRKNQDMINRLNLLIKKLLVIRLSKLKTKKDMDFDMTIWTYLSKFLTDLNVGSKAISKIKEILNSCLIISYE